VLLSLVAAVGVLAVFTVAPGPDMAVVTRTALVSGRTAGLRVGAGIVAGLLLWGGLTVLGLSAVLAASPTAYAVLRVTGVCYLVLLAVRALRAAGRAGNAVADPGLAATDRGRPFLTGLATNVSNPKIAIFYAALLPTLAPAGSGTWGLALLALLHVALTMAWYAGYTVLLDRARAVFQRPRVQRALDRFTGLTLLAFAARLATAPH